MICFVLLGVTIYNIVLSMIYRNILKKNNSQIMSNWNRQASRLVSYFLVRNTAVVSIGEWRCFSQSLMIIPPNFPVSNYPNKIGDMLDPKCKKTPNIAWNKLHGGTIYSIHMGSYGACVSYWDVGGCSFTGMIMTTSVTGMSRSKMF